MWCISVRTWFDALRRLLRPVLLRRFDELRDLFFAAIETSA
jgi:hypothetical protein